MALIQVVSVTESSVTINTDAVNSVLEKVADLPIVVISINGASREGKSYAFNFFIRYLKSQGSPNWFHRELSPEELFPYKTGRERHTVGLNLYPEPFIVPTKYENKLGVLLLDSQGLFDDRTTFKSNAVIFALSNLFSSVLIYNVKSKIEENLLQNLQFFSSYAQAIASHAEMEDQLPSLMFLLRDFSFDQEFPLGFHSKHKCPAVANPDSKNRIENSNNSRSCSENNYFRACFSLRDTMPLENQITRKELLKKFPQISMFLLPFPGKEFLKDSVNNSPDEEFQQHLHQFVSLMMTEEFLIPKQINGKELTGREFQTKINSWARLCEDSAANFPSAPTLSESQMIMRNEMAIFTAFDIFRDKFDSYLKDCKAGRDPGLKAKYDTFFEEAVQIYRNLRRNESEENIQKYLKKLEENCQDIYVNYYVKINEANSKSTEAVDGPSVRHSLLERSNTEALRNLRQQIENLRKQCEPLTNDPKKPPPKPKRTFTARVTTTGTLIPNSGVNPAIPGNPAEENASLPKPPVAEKPRNLQLDTYRKHDFVRFNSNSDSSQSFKYKVRNFFTLLFVEPARELKTKMQNLLVETRKNLNKQSDGNKRYSKLNVS